VLSNGGLALIHELSQASNVNNLTLAECSVTARQQAPRSSRPWSKTEQERLFEAYFDRLPGTCPVCATPVGIRMESGGNDVVLLMRCRGCGNSAQVSQSFAK